MAENRSNQFRLPDLGEGLTGAEIVSWHVAEGSHVIEGQPLVSVETDKAVVEIPSPRSGFVAMLHANAGDQLEVGDVLVTFSEAADAAIGRQESLVGELPEARVKASPKARQRARELDVDLGTLARKARGGVIRVSDVEAAAPAPDRLHGVRRAMAERMTDAHRRVVRATVTGEADIGDWSPGSRPLPRLIRAIGKACAAEPRLNARFDDKAGVLTDQPTVNLGLAMETQDGLFAPVLNDIQSRSADELADDVERLKEAVLNREIAPESLRGQTITLSNFGSVGGLHADMVVIPPQVAIVGAGRSFERLTLEDDHPVPTTILPLSLSFDHRVVTGVEASRFLLALAADLESEE